METNLLKKIQERKAATEAPQGPVDGAASASEAPRRGEDPSSTLFRRLKKEGITEARMAGVSLSPTSPPTSGVDIKQFDDAPDPKQPRLFAGKPVGTSSPSPLRESKSSKGGYHSGWGTTIRMMEDIGWEIVLTRVQEFVDTLTLTEVAQKFQSPQDDLVEAVIQSWRDNKVAKEDIVSPKLQTVQDAAHAFCVYVTKFQEA